MQNGLIKAEPSNNWEIAFATNAYSPSIIINEAYGVKVYTASNDITQWSSLDTSGMLQNQLHNSSQDWELGALCNMGTFHPDYGWGTYDFITHNINGSRIFVLALPNGTLKKLKIDVMSGFGQSFTFTYADLDGSNEVTQNVSKSTYSSKNFIYYSNDTRI